MDMDASGDSKAPITPLEMLYLALALVGLVWPMMHFVPAFGDSGPAAFSELGLMFQTDALAGTSADLFIIAIAAIVWLFVEALRLRMRWGAYLVLTMTTPFAFVFATFLWQRSRRLRQA